MLIKNLEKEHPDIYKRIKKETHRQGNVFNENRHVHDPCGFLWDKSIEKEDIWHDVDTGVFSSFYEFHKDGRLNTKIKEEVELVNSTEEELTDDEILEEAKRR